MRESQDIEEAPLGASEPSPEKVRFLLSDIEDRLLKRTTESNRRRAGAAKAKAGFPPRRGVARGGGVSSNVANNPKQRATDLLKKLQTGSRQKMSLLELLELTHPEEWTRLHDFGKRINHVTSVLLHVTQPKTLYHFLWENWGEIKARAEDEGALIPGVSTKSGTEEEEVAVFQRFLDQADLHVIVRSRRHLDEIEKVVAFGRKNFGWSTGDQTKWQGWLNHWAGEEGSWLSYRRDDGIYDW